MRYKTVFSMCFSDKWYQSGLKSHVCITCWVSFRIKENWFHDFENSAVDFSAFLVLELWFDKTDIDIMMLFKFDFNHAILNFKTIASMKFSFDLNLIWYDQETMFCSSEMSKNGYQKNLKNSVSRVSTDREFPSIDRMFLLFVFSPLKHNQINLCN